MSKPVTNTHNEIATYPVLEWADNGHASSARWRSESGASAPKRVVIADDTLTADAAYRLACEGTAMLWRGDFQNARQLLQALARRADRPSKKSKSGKSGALSKATPAEAFHLHRQAQSQRARTLGLLLIPFDAGHSVPLRRAPDVLQACTEAYGQANEPYVTSLRELLGLISAHEWRKKGVVVDALNAGFLTGVMSEAPVRIHPHYGVFAPVRGEYVALVAHAPLPVSLDATPLAFDIGTGTGVLAAVLANRGIAHVVATDQDARALACARENLGRLGLGDRVEVLEADLFPPGRAALVVCNPPWVPARPSSPIEYAVYDPESRMLRGFLSGLAMHLAPGGEGWLVLSDLAEHLGLRPRAELLALFEAAGLTLLERRDVRPTHGKVADAADPLHAARAAEVTSLWRLAARS